jgi:hypothetical protein
MYFRTMPPETTSQKPSNLKARLLVALAIVAFGSALFVPFLLSGPNILIMAQDQIRGIPSWQVYADYLKKGILPVWWGSELCGHPVYETLPGEGVYPFSVLMMFIVSGIKRVGYSFWIHTLLSGFAAYQLCRRQFSLDRQASTTLATFWMLAPSTLSLVMGGHIGKYWILAILPFMLLGFLRFMDTGKIRWALLISASLGWMLFSTHIQLVYFILWGVFLLWLGGLWALRNQRKALVGRLVGFWLAIGLGLGIGSPILLPAMGYVEKSTTRGDGGDKTSLEHATSWSLHWEDIPSLVVPEFVGVEETYWGENPFKMNTEAPGAVLLTLGLAGLFFARSIRSRTLLIIGVLSIIFGLGVHTPLFELFYNVIPGVKRFRAPSMILFWLAAASLLSAGALFAALDSLEGKASEKTKKILLRTTMGVGIAAVVFALIPSLPYGIWTSLFSGPLSGRNWAANPAAQEAFRFGMLRTGVVVAGSLWVLRAVLSGDLKREAALAIWLVLGLVDVYAVGNRYVKTVSIDQVAPPSQAAEAVAQLPGKFRIMDVQPGAYQQNFHDYYHLENANGFSDIELRWIAQFRAGGVTNGLMQGPGGLSGSKILDIMNVQYVLFKDSLGREGVLPNLSVLPRVWIAPGWLFTPESLSLATILDPNFDHRRRVTLLDEDRSKVGFTPSTDTALTALPAEIVEYTPGKVTLKANASAPSILFLSDAWYSAWQATVDGKPAPVLRANLAFRGVPIPAGSHEVVFRYSNPSLVQAWMLGGICLLLTALLGGLAIWRKW